MYHCDRGADVLLRVLCGRAVGEKLQRDAADEVCCIPILMIGIPLKLLFPLSLGSMYHEMTFGAAEPNQARLLYY